MMRILKTFFTFYITSSVHVALAVTAFSAISAIHHGISPDRDLLFFTFFGTITAYNFIKFAGIAKLHHRSLAKNLKIIQVFSFFCFLALLIFTFSVRLEVIGVAILFGFLTLLYALPFFGRRNLRTIGGIKIYIIALIWAGVTVLCPVVNEGLEVGIDVVIEFLQRFLFVLVLLIPFEIRDLKYDKAELKTMPQNIGIKGAKTVGFFFLMLIVGAEFLQRSATRASLVALGIMAVVTGWCVIKAEEEQSPYFSSFWVEGLPLLWLGILLLFKNLF